MSKTYAQVRTKFLARLNRRDCTTALADGFIEDALTRIQRIPRLPLMEKSVTVTIDDADYVDNGNRFSIPTDFIKIKAITVDGKYTLSKRALGFVLMLADTSTAPPLWYAREGGTWVFAPTPDSDDTSIRIDYYGELATFASDADTALIADVAEDLIVFGALSYAAEHWSDKRADRFEQRFTQIISDLQAMADEDELSDAVVSPALLYPNDDGSPDRTIPTSTPLQW